MSKQSETDGLTCRVHHCCR